MISPERLDQHQQSWAILLGRYGVAAADAYPVFDRLVAAYGEPHRHYHNLEHVTEVLKMARRLSGFASSADAMNEIVLAVWFHDAVYDPKAKDNEERSARLAAAELSALGIGDAVVGRVANLIQATAHTADASPTDPDAAVLLDADLAILGAEPRRYNRYAADIRREYDWVDEVAYRAGRSSVLQAFLQRPRIFLMPTMAEEGEEAARRNMEAELARLAAGMIA